MAMSMIFHTVCSPVTVKLVAIYGIIIPETIRLVFGALDTPDKGRYIQEIPFSFISSSYHLGNPFPIF